MPAAASRTRDVRLALVLNGGVSLAIWIGGVTAEIDSARRAAQGTDDDGQGTEGVYAKLLDALRQDVVVDVIGGASAGGINGVLLGAAIYNSTRLPDLREVWISLGDLGGLLRPATSNAPPSLMRGDEILLPELRRYLNDLYAGNPEPPDQDLYICAPATDLFGYSHTYFDSSGRTFVERDHRRVFSFTSIEQDAETVGPDKAMPSSVWLGDRAAAPELLARAGRASSSFPIAFEAHKLTYAAKNQPASERWLVDGGILDNQPFNPVLDRIMVAPATRPMKRIVLYVVPYVTEVNANATPEPTQAAALATLSAALNLPRDLPKLQGLERIERQHSDQRLAMATRTELRKLQTPTEIAKAADALFVSYRQTRFSAAKAVFEAWALDGFEPGDGVLGQNPAWDPADVPCVVAAAEAARPVPWVPEARIWDKSGTWTWGLSPAERVTAWILLTLAEARIPDEKRAAHDRARIAASELIGEIRSFKPQCAIAFLDQPAQPDRIARAELAYKSPAVVAGLQRIQDKLVILDDSIRQLNAGLDTFDCAATVQDALDVEVVRNAFGVQEFAIPMPFDYLLASAGIENALGHTADSPTTKLAGMKLNHFGGLLKRSWRANDWLWGRLDGIEHLMRALVDPDRIIEIGTTDVCSRLAQVAFAAEEGAPETDEAKAELRTVWATELRKLGGQLPAGDPLEQYAAVLRKAVAEPPGSPKSERSLTACRRLLAARLQLRVLSADLERVAETARDDISAGSSRTASGAPWANRVKPSQGVRSQVQLFKDMRIGEERLEDETSSRRMLGVGSHGLAVATAMFAGNQGGLPTGARTMLGAIRKLTLALSYPVRLLASEPWLGATAFALLVALVVWAASSDGALLGASLPALALLAVILGLAVLTVATSVFEESKASFARTIGFSIMLGVPIAFVILARGPSWDYVPDVGVWQGVPAQLDEHVGRTSVSTASVAALAAAGLALAVLISRLLRLGRRTLLGLYRWAVVGALAALAAGFIYRRAEQHGEGDLTGWASIANERQGAILVYSF